MKASPRNRLITIEGRATAEDGYGGEQETWTEFTKAYAAVYFGTGTEQRAAAQEGGAQAASFEVLSDSKTRAISVINHRIAFDGGIWNITAKQDLGLNEGVRLTAIRAAA